MSKERVMAVIDQFAMSQGFYGRLGRDLREAEAAGRDTSDFFNQFKDCKSTLDVIMMIEC